MEIIYPEPGRYVLAVSGGVDSIALLDMLRQRTGLELVVAHFDHGLRPDSAKDAQLVEQVAGRLKFELGKAQLGGDEASARRARYQFLEEVRQAEGARAIITAHHAGDVVETMVINLLRGTGWRGLCSLRSTEQRLRPLLKVSKAELENYAQAHNLKWREDSTNRDTNYLRNRVRHELLPKARANDPQIEPKLLEIYEKLCELRRQIEPALQALGASQLNRQQLIMLDNQVGREVLRQSLGELDEHVNLTKRLLGDLLVFAKTARPHSRKPLGAKLQAVATKSKISFEATRPT